MLYLEFTKEGLSACPEELYPIAQKKTIQLLSLCKRLIRFTHMKILSLLVILLPRSQREIFPPRSRPKYEARRERRHSGSVGEIDS